MSKCDSCSPVLNQHFLVPTSYVNKELNMARMRLYFNSFSEMLIPTSVWEQTQNEKLEIFSCMEATEIKDIMTR